MKFEQFGLSPELLRALNQQGYTTATPIQAQAIPQVLKGHDVMASAPTGTGKTAAFSLPILQKICPKAEAKKGKRRPTRALVLTPTRELAAQVQANIKSYSKNLPVRSTAIFGGVGMQGQLRVLNQGVDILVATPGRLIDHLERGTANLSQVDTLVLDEADRMLDMGFLPALKKILSHLPKQRQTLLFSATFAGKIKQLADQFLHNPKRIETAPANSVTSTVTHRIHPVDSAKKRDLLLHILGEDSRRQTLVFGRTKRGVDKLVRFAKQYGLKAAAIHGNKSQGQRRRALKDFKDGRVTVLIATDVAARGLDIEQLPLVVNYNLPMAAEDYVHRTGRTGRAGAEGLAVSLVSHDEADLLHDIQRLLKSPLDIAPVEGFEPDQPLPEPKRRKKPSRNRSRKPNTGRRGNSSNRSRQGNPYGKSGKKSSNKAGGRASANGRGKPRRSNASGKTNHRKRSVQKAS